MTELFAALPIDLKNDLMKMEGDKLRAKMAAVTVDDLLQPNNTITTLEIKKELRKRFPDFMWNQELISSLMKEGADAGIFTFTCNGSYRTYSSVEIANQRSKRGESTTQPRPSGGCPTKNSMTAAPRAKTDIVGTNVKCVTKANRTYSNVRVYAKVGNEYRGQTSDGRYIRFTAKQVK